MYTGFPRTHVSLVRCPDDGGALVATGAEDSSPILSGALQCETCKKSYPINDGILCLLDDERLNEESAHERAQRDLEADAPAAPADDPRLDAMEMIPTIRSLRLTPECVVLELGCGGGRYTLQLVGKCRQLLAADFSRASLQRLARLMPANTSTGLVQADVTRFQVAPRAFDRALATLVSNLPTPRHRALMHELVARGLADNGHFVFGTHYYSARFRRRKIPQSGRYHDRGIFRYLFTKAEIYEETRPYFREVRVRPVAVELRFTRRLGLPIVLISLLAQHVPWLNELGVLTVVEASAPTLPEDVADRFKAPLARGSSRDSTRSPASERHLVAGSGRA
jgi:uncharacterized protein YbaR (Trm112 family)